MKCGYLSVVLIQFGGVTSVAYIKKSKIHFTLRIQSMGWSIHILSVHNIIMVIEVIIVNLQIMMNVHWRPMGVNKNATTPRGASIALAALDFIWILMARRVFSVCSV